MCSFIWSTGIISSSENKYDKPSNNVHRVRNYIAVDTYVGPRIWDNGYVDID